MTDKTIFDGLNLDDVKKFEEIISSKKVLTCFSIHELSANSNDNVSINLSVSLYGTDKKTMFTTRFVVSNRTLQETIVATIEWWDKEIVRFNSFDMLTN